MGSMGAGSGPGIVWQNLWSEGQHVHEAVCEIPCQAVLRVKGPNYSRLRTASVCTDS